MADATILATTVSAPIEQRTIAVDLVGPGAALALAAAEAVDADAAAASLSAAAAALSASAAALSELNAGTYLDGVQDAVAGLPVSATLPLQASTRTILAAFTGMAAGRQAILTEAGRQGLFVFDTANRSAQVAADPRQGIYVAPSSAPTGASGAWVRQIAGGIGFAEWFGLTNDGTTDDAPALNAALSQALINAVLMPVGTLGVKAAVVVPTGKTLQGAGRGKTTLKAISTFVTTTTTNGVVISTLTTGVNLRDFTIDANLLGATGMSGTNRLNGTKLFDVVNATVERVDVLNSSGYGHWIHGTEAGGAGTAFWSSGSYRDCNTTNCLIHFEQTHCDGVTVDNCHARSGANTVSGGQIFFHPLTGARNIRHSNCTGVGPANAGVEIIANNSEAMYDISFVNCQVIVQSGGIGFATSGSAALDRLTADNSRFQSTGYLGVNIAKGTGQFDNCRLEGVETAVSMGINSTDFIFSDCTVIATNVGGAVVTGVYGLAGVRFNAGSISISAPAGGETVRGEVYVSAETRLISDQAATNYNGGIRSEGVSNTVLNALSDQNRTVALTGTALYQAFTLYSDATLNLPIGSSIDVLATGTGTKALAAGSGVTLNSPGGLLTIPQYGRARLTKTAANTWVASGNLA